jgi:hypothetical protein
VNQRAPKGTKATPWATRAKAQRAAHSSSRRKRPTVDDQGLLSIFQYVSVFLKAPQVRLEQVKRSLGIPGINARSPQTDYAAFLLLYDAPPLGDEFLGAAISPK